MAEFPKWMQHPAFQPAVLSDDPAVRKPMFFPPIQVMDADQQEYHEANGYRVTGAPDPRIYEPKRVKAGEAPYVHQDYPKWVGDKIVHTKEEEDRLKPGPTFGELKHGVLTARGPLTGEPQTAEAAGVESGRAPPETPSTPQSPEEQHTGFVATENPESVHDKPMPPEDQREGSDELHEQIARMNLTDTPPPVSHESPQPDQPHSTS